MAAAAPSATQESIGVLICDDAADMRDLLATVISLRPGLHVAGLAEDGRRAIEEAERLQPAVILLDLSMPRMTGLEVLPHLRRVAALSSVIVLSGFLARTMASEVLELGAERYLEKGAHPAMIVSAIEEVAAARRAANP